jgi:MoaA/NifB/PqqE/SkfB family radical SAM enzyme
MMDTKNGDDLLPGEKVIELLRIVRKHCDYLVVTGGEPLTHPDFGFIMENLRKLKFRQVILATNGYELDRYADVIAGCVDNLVVSLDTLDDEKADRIFGAGKGVLQKVLSNIELIANHPERRFTITVSAVITPDNIEDLYELYRYTTEHGFEFAAAPQLQGIFVNPSLSESEPYRQLINFMVNQKSKGGYVFGTLRYLRHLRELSPFRCCPTTLLVVSPRGDLYFPCLESGKRAGNLFEGKSLHQHRRDAEKIHGRELSCGNHCHSACMLGFSLAVQSFPSVLVEGLIQLRRMIRSSGWSSAHRRRISSGKGNE